MANSCTWKLVDGVWTIIATNCDPGKVCARIIGGMNLANITLPGGEAPKVGAEAKKGATIKDADFRAAINASAARKRAKDATRSFEGISPALALQDDTTFEMDCE